MEQYAGSPLFTGHPLLVILWKGNYPMIGCHTHEVTYWRTYTPRLTLPGLDFSAHSLDPNGGLATQSEKDRNSVRLYAGCHSAISMHICSASHHTLTWANN